MLKVLSPFGPKIGRLKISKNLIKKINSEVDKITSKKKLAKKFDYSKKLVGQVKQEINLPRSFIKNTKEIELEFKEKKKKFDPEKVYKGQPNPTKL